ncbi:MAG: U32 family peptidase [Mucinivorans sp.]
MNPTKVELLSPAGSAAIGRAAIEAGADAVYIGGDSFGARAAAANPSDDIASLVQYAHQFGARVYQTMNTILFEDELAQAERATWVAWESGVDALIIQDMALLEMSLPPIALHASTQMFNYTADKVKWLEDVGFERVVLERALSLEQIRAIRAVTSVELEAFVHGAICVGLSGQCYLSHALCGRGGNRGSCAQNCRSRYNLIDDKGVVLERGKELLSVTDFNLSHRLAELVDAGVTSLKIEGRLKDEAYVVNNTAYYNQRLVEQHIERTSSGLSKTLFEANPDKTFARKSGTFYFDGLHKGIGAGPKALGQKIGVVVSADDNSFVIKSNDVVNNGDGLCWQMASGEILGSNVNKVNGNVISLQKMENLTKGTIIYRNFNQKFAPSISDVKRKISVDIRVVSTMDGITIVATDEDGISAEVIMPMTYELATNQSRVEELFQKAMSKSGGTIFEVSTVALSLQDFVPHIAMSELNEARRSLLLKLHVARIDSYVRVEQKPILHLSLGSSQLDFRANVANSLAEKFYHSVGVKDIEQAAELQNSMVGKQVMRTRYCLRRERGECLKKGGATGQWFIENNGQLLELGFDCAVCEMTLTYRGKSPSIPAQKRAKS